MFSKQRRFGEQGRGKAMFSKTEVMIMIGCVAFVLGFALCAIAPPALANDGDSSIFIVDPANGLTMDSASGEFEFDATKNSIKIGSKEWKIDQETMFLRIFNHDRPISSQSLNDLGDAVDAKATIICTHRVIKSPTVKGDFLRQVIIHLY